ncbi:MAG: alpha-mannosidase [Candidatus Omnitrophica bacterium]|nr:alpha-mannosidase [Candidatus Omnitrophota bacterium]
MLESTTTQTAHVITHTHWDREWRYPIWQTREMLVGCLDMLLEIFDRDPSYRAFLMDGQAVPIEDYLQIRPENRTRIETAVRDGRLFIGPWYTLPDEHPVSGECLVRNLLKGIRVANSYGGTLTVGYTVFGWGQTAQLPQIYAGFGIDTILFGKTVNSERAPHSEFLWEAPDGTQALTTRLGIMFGRQNFFFTCVIPVCFGEDIVPNDWTFRWNLGGLPYRPADEEGQELDYFRVDSCDGFHAEKLRKALEDAWDTTEETLVPSHRFMGDGCDFIYPQPTVLKIIEEANRLDESRQFRHSSLPEFMEALKEGVNINDLKVVKGELRDGPVEKTTCNALATRSYIKHKNRRVQHRLIQRAEPLAALAYSQGAPYPRAYLDLAWDYLLKSQPHDSINGVTQDKTANDVMYRLDQAEELSKVVENAATVEFLKMIDFGETSPEDVFLVLFNPLPFPRSEIIKVIADTPAEQEITAITVEENGRRMPVQRLSIEEAMPMECDKNARPRAFASTRHTFFLETGEVPAGGFKTLRIGKCPRKEKKLDIWPLPEAIEGSLLKGPDVMENEFLRFSLNADGSFNLLNKITNREYPNQLSYEDSGDVGTYWVRQEPLNNQTFQSKTCPVRTWIEEHGPLSTTFVSEVTMTLPARALKDKSARDDANRDLLIRSYMTLRKGAKSVELRVQFNNNIEDHRLRALFPSGISLATHSCAEGHFCVDERPISPREKFLGEGRYWENMQTLPMQSFVDVSDGDHGLAVINDGLCEFEVMDNPQRTIAITLLRSVRNWICSGNTRGVEYPKQKGGQCQGPQDFRFSLYPHSGDWNEGGVFVESQRFNVPVRPIQCGRGEGGSLGLVESLLEIEPTELVLSALKQEEDGPAIVARVFNPTNQSIVGRLRMKAVFSKAELINLNEKLESKIEIEGGEIPLDVGPNKISTLRLTL